MPKMRGTDLIAHMIAEMRTSAKRAGREVSQENLDQLTTIHRKLKRGHDTMEEAMRELAAFVAEKDPDDGTNDPPESVDGFDDNLPPPDPGLDTIIDSKDARSRSRSGSRGATDRHAMRPMRRLDGRISGRPDLYRTGSATHGPRRP